MITRHDKPIGRPCTHRAYGLSCDEYDALRERAGDLCEICGIAAQDSAHGVMHIDHDPAVGQGAVRGLLCGRCNTGLFLDAVVPAAERTRYLAAPFHVVLADLRECSQVDTARTAAVARVRAAVRGLSAAEANQDLSRRELA